MIQTRKNRLFARTKVLAQGALLAALIVAGLVVAGPAHAANFTVNSTSNTGDLVPNGVCDTNPLPDLQSCTLRAAMEEANVSSDADTIGFNIAGSGVKTIRPSEALPEITAPVTINGYTQPGTSPNTLDKGTNAVLKIELDGSGAGEDVDGLRISTSNVSVRGLIINRFDEDGIFAIATAGVSGNHRIEGNFIGTDPAGNLDRGNGSQGLTLTSGNNTVGGSSSVARNLISGNDGTGITLGFAGANKVQGNLVGTKADGSAALGNGGDGLFVNSDRNLIGDFSPSAANTVAFNEGVGVNVIGDGTANRILANSVFANAGLGIDLEGGTENAAGATKNDPGDLDGGANGLQNKPNLTSAVVSGGTTTVRGKLLSTPRNPFIIQFFSNPPGENEGKKLLGDESVSTNANGVAVFEFVSTQPALGQRITATATNVVEANTSELSSARSVLAP